MMAQNWLFNGHNGATDANLFLSWGLGVQRITAQEGKDVIFDTAQMFGHAGDAYGLLSDLFTEPKTGFGVIFITNGYKPGFSYKFGIKSAFYLPEE